MVTCSEYSAPWTVVAMVVEDTFSSFSLFLSTVALEISFSLCVTSCMFSLVSNQYNGLAHHCGRKGFQTDVDTNIQGTFYHNYRPFLWSFLFSWPFPPFSNSLSLTFFFLILFKNSLFHPLSCTLCSPNRGPHN